MTKDTATAAIREMPKEFDVDELNERLLFMEKVEEGLKQIDNGQKIPLDEVKKNSLRMAKINLSPAALNDLKSIFDYISSDSVF